MKPDTLLHRQINASWLQSGRITRQAFKPSSKDNGRLSVYDGDMMTAGESWTHYTNELGFTSIGVMSVSSAECATEGLPVVPDPAPFAAHVVVDFSGCSKSQVEAKAKRLTVAATTRGWQYEADEPT